MRIRREILISISILLLTGIALANGISTLSIGGDTNGKKGQDAFVYIDAKNAVGVGNIAIDILYDNAVLTANGISSGSLASPTTQNIDNNLGKISLTYTNTNINGSGSLAKLSYHINGNSSSKTDLKISLNKITDTNGKTLKPTLVDSTFTVDSDTTPPTITPPQNIIKEATGDIPYSGENRTAVGLGTATCADDSGSCTVSNDAPSNGFPVGTTTVTWTAKDTAGNTVTAIQTVTITDTIPPNLNIPNDITAEAIGPLSKIDIGNAVAYDLVDPNPIIINDASTNGFPVGITTVTWQAKDKFGNPSPKKLQVITIKDTTSPSITVSDTTVEATGTKTIVNLGSPVVKDIADSNPTVTNNAPTDGFPIGTTIVKWTATDHSGNTASADQTVNVKDTTPPSITISDMTIEASGTKTVVNLGNPVVKDLIDPNPTVVNDAPSDGFPLGTTTVKWTATDQSGNAASVDQTVTVKDTTPPNITISDITTGATGIKTPVNLGNPVVKDLVDSNPTVTNNAPTDGFPIGTTIVKWTATDHSGNVGSVDQSITITNNILPNITAPTNVVAEATGNKTTVALGSPVVKDSVDPNPIVTNDVPVDGFTLGVTNVVWTVKDSLGNTASAIQIVTITDKTAPAITVPANITLDATGNKTIVNLGSPVVKDLVDPSPTVVNNAPLDGFTLGTTNVVWTATDHSGNSVNAIQMVTIIDKIPPNITSPANIVAEATGIKTIVNLGNPVVKDLVDSNPTVTNNSPVDGFTLGTTNVVWTATDHSGNSAYVNQTVTIKDTTPPNMTIPADIMTMATAIKTKIDIGNATAKDLVDPSPIITNDAPTDLLFPVGVTKIIWKATDLTGNNESKTQLIIVSGVSGLLLSADPLHRQVYPNDNAIYNITITNTGLVADSFDLILNGSMEKENLNINSTYLGPSESKVVELTTSDSHIGSRTTFVNAVSRSNKSLKANISITTEVIEVPINSGPSGGGSGGSSSNANSGVNNVPSGGGGGGGGGAPSAEPFLNINKVETRDKDLVPNVVVTYTFSTPDLGIYEAGITGTQSESDVPMKVELLKGPSNGTDKVNTGVTYKYLNLYIGSKKVNKVYLRFKVNNTWIDNSGISKDNIKLFRYDTGNKKWIGLVTTLTKSDANYTYFDSQPDHFSSFAIVGLNPQNAKKAFIIPVPNAPNSVSTPNQDEYPVATYIEGREPVGNIEDLKGNSGPNNLLMVGIILISLVVGFIFLKKKNNSKNNLKCKSCNKLISGEPIYSLGNHGFDAFCTEKCKSEFNQIHKR